MLNPNQLKIIEIRFKFWEKYQEWLSKENRQLIGAGGYKVTIYDLHDKLITSILEPDGYFSYLGLKSDQYIAKLILQLESLQIKAGFTNFRSRQRNRWRLCRYFGIYS
jgi:hypothetical protein